MFDSHNLVPSHSHINATQKVIAQYERAQAPDANVVLGVISNPFSRTNARTRLHDRLLPRFMPDPDNAIDTRTLNDLDRALYTMLFERNVNVLGLNGGDGTLHAGINRLVFLMERIQAITNKTLPLPKLLFLNGGTLNIVSRATGTKASPVRTIRNFSKRYSGQLLGHVDLRRLSVLKVQTPSQTPRYGFVFGSEVVANALEMYTMFGEGYSGLARFLTEFIAGYAFHTRMWQEHAWKLDSPTTPAIVNDVVYPRYCCTVAATIDLSILKGLITAFRVPQDGKGFFVKTLLEQDPDKIIAMIPRLMAGVSHPAVHDNPDAVQVKVSGGYTLDGELFIDRSPNASEQIVQITRASFDLMAVQQ